MRKVYITATVKLILSVDEGVDVGEAVQSLQVITDPKEGRFDVEDARFTDSEITDSK